jgi:HSP20 family molecular chaperone IbpA
MTRLSLFNNPLLLGFDQIERTLQSISKAPGEGYPPYNIEQIGDDKLRITLAVAGFALEDLEVQLDENRLTVRGRRSEEDEARVYLHRGIAARQFQRSFVLAEGVEVVGAALETGLLHVDLQRHPVERPTRAIPIANGGSR